MMDVFHTHEEYDTWARNLNLLRIKKNEKETQEKNQKKKEKRTPHGEPTNRNLRRGRYQLE